MEPDRFLVASGAGQRIISSGGGTSYLDLGLYLVARFFGAEEAMRVARVYLIDWHREGQLPFAALGRATQTRDATVAEAQEWVALNYANSAPFAEMVERSALPDCTFKRRFKDATGLSPLDYVHAVRLEEAKQLLETSDLAMPAIAREVGYGDDSFFRCLFRRKVGPLLSSAGARRCGTISRKRTLAPYFDIRRDAKTIARNETALRVPDSGCTDAQASPARRSTSAITRSCSGCRSWPPIAEYQPSIGSSTSVRWPESSSRTARPQNGT